MRETTVLAHQHSGYRVFGEGEADRLLQRCGFRHQPGADERFRQYVRV